MHRHHQLLPSQNQLGILQVVGGHQRFERRAVPLRDNAQYLTRLYLMYDGRGLLPVIPVGSERDDQFLADIQGARALLIQAVGMKNRLGRGAVLRGQPEYGVAGLNPVSC